jgi:hypothetical protein
MSETVKDIFKHSDDVNTSPWVYDYPHCNAKIHFSFATRSATAHSYRTDDPPAKILAVTVGDTRKTQRRLTRRTIALPCFWWMVSLYGASLNV